MDARSASNSTTSILKPPATIATAAPPPDLPQLPYSLRTRKLAVAIVWTVILLDSVVLPVGLFYILKYAAHWPDIKNMGLTSGIFGFISLLQYVLRLYRLLLPSGEYRPLNSPRWALDFYQFQFTLGFVLITLVISLAIGPEDIALLGLTPALLPALCGPQFLVSCWAYRRGWRIPVRLSSLPRGSMAPPAVYTIVEDVVAVDGGGGREWRRQWGRRWEVSAVFRELMWGLTAFWGWGCVGCVGVVGAVCFTAGKYVAFAFGWCFPFVWAGVWAAVTTVWVQRELRREKDTWGVENAVALG